MSPRTETPFEFSGWERFTLLGVTVLILCLVFFTGAPGDQLEYSRGFQFTLYPWLIAGSATISNGLDVFSGLPVSPPSDLQRLSMLGGLLLGLVIGPTLILFAWRNAKLNPAAGGSRVASLVGGMLIYALALPSIPAAVLQWSNYSAMQAAQKEADERDELSDAIQLVLRDAKQYRILPSSEAGGGGSFSGYTPSASVTQSRFAVFQVVTADDSLVVVKGTAPRRPAKAVIAAMNREGAISWNYEGY